MGWINHNGETINATGLHQLTTIFAAGNLNKNTYKPKIFVYIEYF